MNNRNLVCLVLSEGGIVKPILIPSSESSGLGLCNPSVFIDDGEIWIVLRNVNYTLYHCENEQTFNNRWGPLSYLNPEHDLHLRTTNFLCKLTPELDIASYRKIDTSALDKPPLWEFVGLEDARLVRWNGKLYGIGVRRDTTTNGQGRMELSEIEVSDIGVKEVNRYRIEPPLNPESYCEKNWMPVLDKPYHFIKWTNPAELVEVDLETLKSSRAQEVKESDKREGLPFLRGSSQVIPWRGYYVCVVHDCDLFKNRSGQKDATYMHRFVVYDRDWNIVKIGDQFSFMDGEIEFCCGLAEWQGDFLITFGFQDNCAFILRVPSRVIPKLLGMAEPDVKWRSTEYPTLEITTAIPRKGCPLQCVFCPQDKLISIYSGERVLPLSGFKQIVSKLPREIQITFAGYCEPFVNPDCMEMIHYAHSTGHKVSVWTTSSGLREKDIDELKTIPFTGIQGGFVLHLPDVEGYFSRPLNADTMRKYEALAQAGITNFQTVTMGTLPEKLKVLFPETVRQTMYSRAGNIDRKDVIQIDGTGEPKTCGCQERLYHSVLLPNGDVTLCCMDYGLKHILGNLFKQSYDEIMPTDRMPFALCEHCENGVPA